MTAKEKASELVLKFRDLPQEGTLMFYIAFEISKQCALIAVDEIMKAVGWEEMELGVDRDNYYEEVKQEILKL
jgi:hypothetical protein